MSNNDDWQHAYDDTEDIKENQGYIPVWFSALFYGMIIIGIVYTIGYHFIFDWSQDKEYQQEIALFNKTHKQTMTLKLTKDGTNPLRGNQEAIANGAKIFAATCSMCHKADATGLIGPSLVDNKWLHGNTDKANYDAIMEGVEQTKTKLKPTRGPMPAHKNSLGARKSLQVLAWLASKNKNLKVK